MQEIAQRLIENRKKYKPIIDKAQKFINNKLPIDNSILSEYEKSQIDFAEIFADLISSFGKNKNYDRLKRDLYDIFWVLEEKFGCGHNLEREKFIGKQMANAIERYFK